jgi:hypothetical protein
VVHFIHRLIVRADDAATGWDQWTEAVAVLVPRLWPALVGANAIGDDQSDSGG